MKFSGCQIAELTEVVERSTVKDEQASFLTLQAC